MKQRLIQSFHQALSDYTNIANRGYKMGFFTYLRHSFTKTAKLRRLENALRNCKNDENALSIMIEHLVAKDATFNHHSFNSYLIDALKVAIPTIHWDCFTPKAIKTYQGSIYRGTSQPPEKIFQEGFKELIPSSKVEDYLKFRNGSIGISTTRDFDCAMEYATNNNRSNKQRYIYVINYRDDYGYDVLETGKSRGLSFHPFFHKDRYSGWKKHEINIKGKISNKDIIGAWKILKNGMLAWLDNKHFQLNLYANTERLMISN